MYVEDLPDALPISGTARHPQRAAGWFAVANGALRPDALFLQALSRNTQLTLNPELLNPLTQRGARDAEQFGGVELVAVSFLQSLDAQLALDRRDDLQFRIAPGPLEQLPRHGRDIRRTAVACRQRNWDSGSGDRALPGNLRRQIARQNRVPLSHYQGAAEDVLQFADIARPVVFFQRPDRAGGNGFGRMLRVFGESLEEVVHEQPDVLAPLA